MKSFFRESPSYMTPRRFLEEAKRIEKIDDHGAAYQAVMELYSKSLYSLGFGAGLDVLNKIVHPIENEIEGP